MRRELSLITGVGRLISIPQRLLFFVKLCTARDVRNQLRILHDFVKNLQTITTYTLTYFFEHEPFQGSLSGV